MYYEDEETRVRKYVDPEVTLVLKETKNPIPMYAVNSPEIRVPEYGKKLGFDLAKADWVAPYGKGKSADIFFQVDGYYNGRKDFDSTLTLSFPNDGDGLIPFEGEERKGSQFISPYEAPLNGYIAEKKWRLAIIPTDDPGPHGLKAKGINDYEKAKNYILRVQTVLDSNGDVKSAKYAKIYGDIQFDGVSNRDSHILINSYYLNPNTNDRNLEYAVGQNLFKNLQSFEDPKLP